jgi:hypothetical protein
VPPGSPGEHPVFSTAAQSVCNHDVVHCRGTQCSAQLCIPCTNMTLCRDRIGYELACVQWNIQLVDTCPGLLSTKSVQDFCYDDLLHILPITEALLEYHLGTDKDTASSCRHHNGRTPVLQRVVRLSPQLTRSLRVQSCAPRACV